MNMTNLFEKMLFHEDMADTSTVKKDMAETENVHHVSETNRISAEIQNNWNIYFTSEKNRPSVVAYYLGRYKEAKKSAARSQVRGYLSQLYGYLLDKEMLTKHQCKAYEAKIKEVQAEYAKDPKNKKLKSTLAKLISEKSKLNTELRIIGKYKTEFSKSIDCPYII